MPSVSALSHERQAAEFTSSTVLADITPTAAFASAKAELTRHPQFDNPPITAFGLIGDSCVAVM
jgi:hypothetical protein